MNDIYIMILMFTIQVYMIGVCGTAVINPMKWERYVKISLILLYLFSLTCLYISVTYISPIK